jgi:hypothetical protein
MGRGSPVPVPQKSIIIILWKCGLEFQEPGAGATAGESIKGKVLNSKDSSLNFQSFFCPLSLSQSETAYSIPA